MRYIPESLREQVIHRAQNYCEYCGLSQIGQEATFHIDHIFPLTAGGETSFANLALACVSCSLRKGARQTAIDPKTNQTVPIFNPRSQNWFEHFAWDDVSVVGLTAIGRATLTLLVMNRPTILAIRQEQKFFQRHPQPQTLDEVADGA
ncbi:HNH endonuclease signature motif containing protein [Spirulina sp. CCNP1310]|uniref:HNH endonuclease n=1 Tax=Spirulina sp. CCNP1310 TaxID=3110249 RepID=UPI002B1ED9FC|nr:HNH endonuclease signature motif containing protein [Spirulina sp. CCNP1310]MEA5421078.1 HNH endonuclease signature motif containing protein [Spirulina sp. CCNP1310]